MSGEQPDLFDFSPVIPVNSTVDQREAQRLCLQSHKILQRLRMGPALNTELAEIGIRYSARIGEMRKVGYRIEITDRNHDTGVNTYVLVGEPG